jgi:hypothetical protein
MVSSEFRSNAIRFAERRSGYPVVTIWAMNSGERDLAPIENWSAEDALIVRPHLEAEVRLLPPGGAVFLRALGEGTIAG